MLVVGDIHGCYAEFQDLLDKAGLSAGDSQHVDSRVWRRSRAG
jgi:hypothetical protein